LANVRRGPFVLLPGSLCSWVAHSALCKNSRTRQIIGADKPFAGSRPCRMPRRAEKRTFRRTACSG
jgi:hypothetical protein